MKTIVLCLVAISVVGFMLVSVKARSPVVCEECKVESCVSEPCPCGTFKDECQCCDLCRVCPRESCSILAGDVCQEGYVCAHAPGTTYIERHNNPGTCVPTAEAPPKE